MTDAPRPDPVVHVVTTAATRRLAEQTATTLRARADVVGITARFGACRVEHRAGHLFEVLHAWTFDVDAIRKGSSLRLEWHGPANGPVDLRLVDGESVLAEVQTKLYGRPVQAAHALARGDYAGMTRVVPSDQTAAVGRVFDKRLGLPPDSLNYDGYVDARAHLAGAVSADGVSSTAFTRPEVLRIADRPVPWMTARAAVVASRQVGVAVAAGCASGALLTGAFESVTQVRRVRAGETTTAEAARAVAGVAGSGAVRSGAVAGVGEIVRIAATAAGSTALPAVLRRVLPALAGRGPAPMLVAEVVVDVTMAGTAWARGEIDAGELAVRGGEATLQAVCAGAFGLLGQAVLPVPGVGLVLGGVAGRLVATVALDALRSWSAVDEHDTDDAVAAIEAVADDLLEQAVACTGAVFGWLAEIASDVAAQPFPDTFDDWMRDPASTLTLDPNPAG